MKRILSFLALLVATAASGQVNVQKTSGTNEATGSLVIGSGKTLTPSGTGVIISTGGTASTVPWSGVTGTPTTLTGYGVTNTLSTTAPLTGGGTLSSNLTLAMPAATNLVSGYLTYADWATFNAKQNALTFPIAATLGGTGQSTWTLGDFLYSSAANTLAKLAGNTSATLAVLTQTGTGTVSAAPVWTSTTGTGNVVRATSPTLVTPILGAATATSVTGPTTTDLTLAGGSTGASLVLGQGTSGNLVMSANSAERARFTATGNLLIGTTTDTSSRLKLVGIDNSGPKTWTASSAALSGALFDSYQDSGGNGFQRYTDIVSLQDSDGVNGGGVIRFVTNSVASDSGIEAMRVTKAQNLLIGTTTDSGNGKLQLATHTTSAGGIGFGTDVSLFRSATGVLRLAGTSNYLHEIVNTAGTSAATTVYSNTGGNLFVGIDSSSGGAIGAGAYSGVISRDGAYPLILRTNGTTALTLASNQAATFAGAVTVNAISGINALAAGTQLATFESSVNGAAVELITKGKNSTGTARQANIGINRFADDVLSFSNGTTESLRLHLTTQAATFAGAVTVNGTDKFILLNGATTQFSRALDVRTAGDTEGRLLLRGGGSLLFGDGAGTFDSTLARTGASMLTVTGGLTISSTTPSGGPSSGALQVAGGIYAGANSVFGGTINAGSVINASGINSLVKSTDGTVVTKIQSLSVGDPNVGYVGTESNHPLRIIVGNTSRLTIDTAGAATFAGAVTAGGNVTVNGSAGVTASDLTLGTSGPSVKSSLAARAARQGLVFDGTTGATVANVPAFGTGDFTVAAWINASTITDGADHYIVGGPTNSFAMRVEQTTGVVSILRIGGGLLATSTPAAITIGKQALVCVRRSGSTNTFSINGIDVGTPVTDSTNYSAASTKIGNTDAVWPWKGQISNTLIYNRALSATEVVSLYESGVPSGADYNTASNTNLATSTVVASGGTLSGESATGFTMTSASGVAYVGTRPAFGATTTGLSGVAPVGSRWLVTFTATLTSGAAPSLSILQANSFASISNTATVTAGSNSVVLTTTANGTWVVCPTFYTIGASTYTISAITVTRLGLLLAPDAAQAGGGLAWYDTSGNAANITLPASGVTWNVPTSGYFTAPTTTNLTLAGGSTGASLVLGQGATAANIVLTPKGTGNVGVGTTTPSKTLEVFKNVATSTIGSGEVIRILGDDGNTVGRVTELGFGTGPTGATFAPALIGAVNISATGYGSKDIYFATRTAISDVAPTERMRITTTGNLIIGSPFTDGGQKLQVNGTASFAGAVTTTNGTITANAGTGALTIAGSNTSATGFGAYLRGGSTVGSGKYLLQLVNYDASKNYLFYDDIATFPGAATFAGAVTAGGKITSSVSTATGYNQLYDTTGITTGRGAFAITSTGAGLAFGVESSVGGTSFTGSTAYASYFGTTTATPIHFVTNSVIRQTISSTGAATFAGAVTVAMTSPEIAIRSASDAAGQNQFLTFGSTNYNRAQFKGVSAGTNDGSLELRTFNAGAQTLSQTWNKDGSSTFAGAVSAATSLTAQTGIITGTNSAASYPLTVKNNSLKASASQYNGILIQTADASSVDLGLLYFTAVSATDRGWRLGAFDNANSTWSKGSFPGAISIGDTTGSSSTTTGSLTTAGGLGVAGSAYLGGAMQVNDNIAAAKNNQSATISLTPSDYAIRLKSADSNTYVNAIAFSEGAGIGGGVVNSAIAGVDLGTGGSHGIAIFTGNNTAISRALLLDSSQNATFAGAVKSTSPTGGIGYGAGAGGSVTQLTSKSTAVTLNKIAGQIVTAADALAKGDAASFTFTNSTIAATDVIVFSISSGATAGEYMIFADAVSAGSCRVTIKHMAGGAGGSLSEALTINYSVIKSVAN